MTKQELIQRIFNLLKAEGEKEENMSYTENCVKLHLDKGKGIHLEIIIEKQNYLSLQVHFETDSVDKTFERLSNIIKLNSDLLNKELIANNSKYKTKYVKVDAKNTIMGLLKLYTEGKEKEKEGKEKEGKEEGKANWCGFELLNLEENEHNTHKIVDVTLEYKNNLKIK